MSGERTERPRGDEPVGPRAIADELAAVRMELDRLRATLARSEAMIGGLIERHREGMALVAADGRIRTWNPAMEAISGIPAGEAIGRALWDVEYGLAPEDGRGTGLHETLREAIRAILSMDDVRWFGSPRQREIRRPDGTRRLVETVMFPIAMEGVISLGTITRDITAQHHVERRVADIARLVAEAPSPTMRATADGRLSYANLASAPLLRAWRCAVGQPLPDAWAARVRQALAASEPSTVEAVVGERIYTLVLMPIPMHGEVNVYGMDTTDLRRVQEALHESEAHYRRAFEQAPIGIALVEPAGSLIEINKAMLDLVGYSRDELVALQWHDLVHPDDVERVRQHMERVAAGEEGSYRLEERLVTREGTVRWAIVDGALLRTVADEPMYLLLQVQDITERRLADELSLRVAVAARVAEAEERERRRVAQELHDRVGQELSALGISLGLLRGQTKEWLSPSDAARLEDALALVRQITAGVRSVMAELRPPMLDEYGLLAALRWYAGVFADRVGVAVRVVGREPVPRLPSSIAIMLFRIAQEALSNVARHAQASRVEMRLSQRAEIVRLTITDNGRGFDPSVPIETTTERGWGVRTMAERAAAIGARLRLASHPGSGTRVVVELPWPAGASGP